MTGNNAAHRGSVRNENEMTNKILLRRTSFIATSRLGGVVITVCCAVVLVAGWFVVGSVGFLDALRAAGAFPGKGCDRWFGKVY